ncbi:MAG TPA: DUF2000 family protein [Rhabdochlamydiaceae bacterium]|nr:DUF2000 family protein [Rhabdochlamydiaceae bacterium]
MKRYFSLVNASIPLGKGLNALAHSAIGIGHWIPKEKMPHITVLFTDEETIREFRREAHKIALAHPTEIIYSDFANTMTVGITDNCVKVTRETHENELIYYAATICIEEEWLESSHLYQIINRCKILKNYQPYCARNGEDGFEFKKIITLPEYQSLPTKKLSLTLERTRPIAELINATVIACLSIGMQADLSQLKLIVYVDADNQEHPYISYHPFPILAARQQSKFNELAVLVERDQNIERKVLRDVSGNTIAMCILGTEDQVNAHTRQKFISLWTAGLSEDGFICQANVLE